MSDFKAKMHQIRFRLGPNPGTRWGVFSAPPDTLAGFKGLLIRGGEERDGGEGGKEVVRKKEGGEGKGKRGESVPLALILEFDHWWCATASSTINTI